MKSLQEVEIGAQEHKCLGLYCYYSAAHAPFLWELSHEPNFSSGAHNCVNLHQRKSLGKRKMFSNATLDRSLSIFCFFPITIKRNFSLVSPDIPLSKVHHNTVKARVIAICYLYTNQLMSSLKT